MEEVDKWASVIGLIALLALVVTMGCVGAEPREIGGAGAGGGLVALLYALGRGIYEKS